MTSQQALRSAMAAEGLRAEDVASKAGVNINTVYNVLAGRNASRLTIMALKQTVPGFAERYDDGAAVA